jgi:hypothetical protein
MTVSRGLIPVLNPAEPGREFRFANEILLAAASAQ